MVVAGVIQPVQSSDPNSASHPRLVNSLPKAEVGVISEVGELDAVGPRGVLQEEELVQVGKGL